MRLARRADAIAALVEGPHALGAMLFGAGIRLAAQFHHIEEQYPNALLVRSLGTLALAWSTPSVARSLLTPFLAACWAGVEAFRYRAPMHGAPLLVILGVLPRAW